ncbi:hypothetical protein MUY14_00685 [Amycolatopsis sp. FBCC-B4732]|uniref:hypothetical protein n=1 Tax=Amycolatopsis sp. FBCC-B4732 TaxID=3079339 RepID=UPI001FF12E95|nr:hypothetical protein [Amycolatopsis sp. FBCC-B4732]UOX89196.1 hypothetical protein MUY14_00685 [Amycolatopsis sp. FBCC-B4732]
MAVPEALAGIPGVRTAAQLGEPDPAGRLTVLPALAGLLPGGALRRGTTVSVRGATSLVLALVAAATRDGSWAAVTGLPELGLAAAAELGVDLDRIALVPHPGAEPAAVVSALVDGFDLVVLGRSLAGSVPPQLARRLAGRVRNRGSVLLAAGSWPGADLELTVSGRRWHGLSADGHGHLRSRSLVATSRGRGSAGRPRSLPLQLPGPAGALATTTRAEAPVFPARVG